MTREIMKMPAGREMDALIATDVMKWEELKHYDSHLSRDGFMGWMDRETKTVQRPEFWNPSESIEDAWVVVEKLRKKYQPLKFYLVVDKKIRACITPILLDDEWEAIGETVPLAICRAALLAVIE